MKKTLVIISILLILVITPAAALDFGVNFNAGVRPSMINVYTYQNVAFRMEFTESFGMEAGLDVMENYVYSPYFYFSPMLSLYFEGFYLAGGATFNSAMTSPSETAFYFETGFRFGDWQLGPGIGNVDVGFNFSPTVYNADTGDGVSDMISSVFGTIFNLFKLKIGFSWYLPL